MTLQTARQSSIDAYLAYESDAQDERNEQRRLRHQRLLRFPHAMMLEVAFPELDCVNRWCWTNFGPRDGDCTQKYSEYRVCGIDVPHSHAGVWTDHWFTKTDYNFGFNEWYFADRSHYDQFVKNIPNINWGKTIRSDRTDDEIGLPAPSPTAAKHAQPSDATGWTWGPT